MMSALVLVCQLSVTPHLADCDLDNAVDQLAVPGEFHSPFHCLRDAEAFFAAAYPLETIAADQGIKVVCRRPSTPKTVG
jgi:hypothetical protein